MLKNESLKDYSKRLAKNLSDSTSTAANTLGVSEVWAKNFKAIQGNEDFLKYTKGYTESLTSYTNANGKFVKVGDFVDSSGNKVNLNATGHGFNAEIMNHENDIWALRNASLEGGNNAPNGADRIVDSVKIQSKYLKTGARSVGAAFDNKRDGNYRYYDESGKPMVLEVPKEQYEQAIKTMEEKIRQGKVPSVSDPQEAKNLIKKGSVTYEQAKNYSKFCSKESLKFDTRNGIVVASIAFGVSFVINTSLCYYKERDIKKALKESIIIGIQTGGKAFAVYMIGAQAQRIPALNHLLQQIINFDFNKNIVGKALAKVAAGGAKEGATKYGISINTAANSALRGTIITAATMIALTSSIEIAQMMKGQISNMQCVKNIINNANSIAGGAIGALAGAAIGTSILPFGGTFLGGLIGGIVGGMGAGSVSKKVMDYFIKDDTLKKQAVFFEQMIVLAVLFKLNENEVSEFRNIVDKIIQDDASFFGDKFRLVEMVSHSNRILKPIVVAVVSQRPKLPVNVFDKEVVNGAFMEEINEDNKNNV